MSCRILIMAGGTGGHVFPALAVAEELRANSHDVVWLGTHKGLEARVVPAAGFPMEWISVSGLRGRGPASWLMAPFRIIHAVTQALGVMRRRNPSVVLGMGGFASGPGGLAAWLVRRPLVIHEQNAVSGLTNRLLAPLARRVLEAFPGSFSTRIETRVVGNPVRPEIMAIEEPGMRLGERAGPLRIFVVGGSQGALALNRLVPEALARLVDSHSIEVIHQAGERTFETAREAYAAAGIDARVERFIEDMAAVYAWADLVVCRSGAITVSELAAAGLGAVLVPFPAAVDDHQTRNAAYLADAGAALIMPEAELDARSLAGTLDVLLGDRQRLLDMALAARGLARPRAVEELTETCVGLAGGGAA